MNKIFLTLFIILIKVSVFAQAPDKMSYQAVIRNSSNKLVANTAVGMRISILQSSATGTAVYVETQKPTTNLNGLAGIEIGSGTVVSGTFATIDWSKGPYFIKTETDPGGGTNYTISGTSQLLSVPYALYAKKAGNSFSGNYNDLTNKPTIPTKVSELNNDKGYISKFTEKDSSVTNEIQTLSIKGDTLLLSKAGGFVKLPAIPKEKDSSVTNEIQDLSIKGDTLLLSKTTGFVKLPAIPTEKDSSVTNEIQSLSVRNDTIFLSKNGGFVVLPKSNLPSNSSTSNGSFYFHSLCTLSANDSLATKYSNGYAYPATYKEFSFLVPRDGIIKNLITTPTEKSVSSGSTVIISILINGKPTSLNVNLTNTDGFNVKSNTTNTVSVKKGDFIAIQYKSKGSVAPGTPFQAIVELAPNAPKNEFAHYIGELYGGGIVVSVWKDTSGAEHGLVASLKDLSSSTVWSNVSSTLIGASAQSSVDGKSNTGAIVSQSGHTSGAAQICDTFNGGGYNDWYLPAMWELNQCFNSAFFVNTILGTTNGFKSSNYWSSTEDSYNQVYVIVFASGTQGGNTKNSTNGRVRAMRRY